MAKMTNRERGTEYMDDLGLSGEPLRNALYELIAVNRYLGGYAATRRILSAFLAHRRLRRVTLLDLGSGLADIPAYLVQWAARRKIDLRITAVEGNPEAAREATRFLDETLQRSLRSAVQVVQSDVWSLPPEIRDADVVTASLFLHHLDDQDVVRLLRLMQSRAQRGIIVNDLHRHWLSYHGVQGLARLFRASDTFRHDGPLSVRRGFRRQELEHAARAADLAAYEVRWHWAFRWTLSTLK